MANVDTSVFSAALEAMQQLSSVCDDVEAHNSEEDARAAFSDARVRPPPLTQISVTELKSAVKGIIPVLESICASPAPPTGAGAPASTRHARAKPPVEGGVAERLVAENTRDVNRLHAQTVSAVALARDLRKTLEPPGCCASLLGPSPKAAAAAAAELGRRGRALARELDASAAALRAATTALASLTSGAVRLGVGVMNAVESGFSSLVGSVQGAVKSGQASVAQRVITGGASSLVEKFI
jgi:hypothetical protein